MHHARSGRSRRRLALALASWPVASLAGPAAQHFSREETAALRAAVQAQLAALAAGDAEGAWGMASAAIHKQFGDARRFMGMVRSAYPMLIHPRRVDFLLPERTPAAVVQPVHVQDQAGKVWLASYRMEPAAAGGWRIGGCVVVASPRRMST